MRAEPGRAGRRLHLHLRDRGRAGRRQGRDGGQAAGALRIGRPGGAGVGGDRDPRRSSTTRSTRTIPTRARCWYGSGRRAQDHLRRARAGRAGCDRPQRLRGGRHNGRVRRGQADHTPDQPGAEEPALRARHHRRHRQEPGRQALDRRRHPDPLQDHVRGQPRLLRLRRDRRPRGAHHRPRRLVGLREHDVRRRRHRGQCRLADRRRPARRRPGRQGPRRRPLRHRPEGRPDPDHGQRRLDDRLHDAARPPDHLRRRRPRPRRLHVRRHHLRGRQGQGARHRLRARRVDRRRHASTSTASSASTASAAPPEFQKFVCGKKLYNYDNLEPSERKLVL